MDALNVYPLPDGDTGRNMHQTIASALARAREAGPSAAEVSAALAQGALMGARGNSGVILSQILRGFREAFAGRDEIGAAELREAFAHARRNAYAAVDRPAEGTMLSLCAAIDDRLGPDGDFGDVLGSAVAIGAEALGRTMEDNPLNRAAGVVDAGAYGFWLFLVGALGAVEGEAAARVVPPPLRRPGTEGRVVATAPAEVASWTGGHCVQYLVPTPRRSVEDLRREMLEAGADSVAVVGGDDLIKVHAHAQRPERVIEIGESAGTVDDLVVEAFDEMVARHERATGIVLRSPPRRLAAIAVVPGEGFAEIVRSFYATPLLGGAAMNPSVGEIVGALERANAQDVVVLPNDRNVILAAKQAAAQVECRVEVVETRNTAQGMAAVVRFDPMGEPAAIVEQMRRSADEAHAIEVTRATRDATVDDVAVRAGDAIGLLDGRLVARGADPVEVLGRAAPRLLELPGVEAGKRFRPEAVTLYAGADVAEEDVDRAAERLRGALPEAEVEVRRGGQPLYPYIVQAE